MQITMTDDIAISLLKKAISIPSFVDITHNENVFVDFLEEWVKLNLPEFDVFRQPLEGGRFNLILKKGKPETIFLAHTDTVQPSQDAPFAQLEAFEKDDFIWGRGATDMKSGLVAMLCALKRSTGNINNLWYFLYADEEYDFLGMKALVKEYGDIRPKIMVSSDGSDLQIGHGCRGLLEFRGRFLGKTGHPAKGNGKSAIQIGYKILSKLEEFVSSFKHPVMGNSTFNVAYFLGGAKTPSSFSENKFLVQVGQAGNVVSDVAEFVLDVRPADPELSLDLLIKKIEEISSEFGIAFEVIKRTHSLGAWYTEPEKINIMVETAKAYNPKPLGDPKANGYIDLQMLWEAVGRPAALIYGGGIGNSAHTPEEKISKENFLKEIMYFEKVINFQI